MSCNEPRSSKDFARLLLAASDQEQRLIGQELHDGLCQDLAGIAFLMQSMQRKLESNGNVNPEDTADVADLLCKAVSRARGLSHGLYPVSPLPNGLIVALQRLADDTAAAHQISCAFFNRANGVPIPADEFVATNLFRIVQEAVRVSIRNSQPRKITIAFTQLSDVLKIEVKHDRKTSNREGSFGEFSLMEHRAHAIGAELETSDTSVSCVWPIPAN